MQTRKARVSVEPFVAMESSPSDAVFIRDVAIAVCNLIRPDLRELRDVLYSVKAQLAELPERIKLAPENPANNERVPLKQAAAILGVSQSTVRNYIDDGTVPPAINYIEGSRKKQLWWRRDIEDIARLGSWAKVLEERQGGEEQ